MDATVKSYIQDTISRIENHKNNISSAAIEEKRKEIYLNETLPKIQQAEIENEAFIGELRKKFDTEKKAMIEEGNAKAESLLRAADDALLEGLKKLLNG